MGSGKWEGFRRGVTALPLPVWPRSTGLGLPEMPFLIACICLRLAYMIFAGFILYHEEEKVVEVL